MNNKPHRPILVLGGTGHYGREIVRCLRQTGRAVRVLSRDGARARQSLGPGVDVVAGDVTDPAAVAAALDGVTRLAVSISAFTPQSIRQLWAIERDGVLAALAQAEQLGVRRVVYLSVYALDPQVGRETLPLSAQIKADVEAALARSALNWTVLGAPPSMELFFTLLRGDVMIVPVTGAAALPVIAPSDLGEIAAQALLRDDLAGQRIRLAGPEALSFAAAAERIGRASGRTVRLRRLPPFAPRAARLLLRPLAHVSTRACFAYHMLGFMQLLGRFPTGADAAAAHQLLLDTFDYRPTTLEMEARRRGTE